MIFLSEDQRQKVSAIDDMIHHLPVEDIKKIYEADQIVDTLKAKPAPTDGVMTRLIMENNRLESELMQVRSDCFTLRTQMQQIVRMLSRPHFDPQNSSDMMSLKASLSIYN